MRPALAYLLVVAALGSIAFVVLRKRDAAPTAAAAGGVDESLWGVSLPSLDFGTWGDDAADSDDTNSFFDSVLDVLTPRGIRNRNPGNVRVSSSAWLGKVPAAQNTDGTFEQFTDPLYGLRVIAYLLLKYQRDKNKHTIKALIEDAGGWAPVGSADKNPASYGDAVAQAVGVSETTPIDLSSGNMLNGIVAAIVKFENGQQPYPDTLIASAVASARSALS